MGEAVADMNARFAFVDICAAPSVAGVAIFAVAGEASRVVVAACLNMAVVKVGRALINISAIESIPLISTITCAYVTAAIVTTVGVCVTMMVVCVALVNVITIPTFPTLKASLALTGEAAFRVLTF